MTATSPSTSRPTMPDGYGLAQFGTRNDPKRTLPPIKHEPTTLTKLSHRDGTLSMAMATPGTAAGDFFITVGDLSSMDATADTPGFAAFGSAGVDSVGARFGSPCFGAAGAAVCPCTSGTAAAAVRHSNTASAVSFA